MSKKTERAKVWTVFETIKRDVRRRLSFDYYYDAPSQSARYQVTIRGQIIKGDSKRCDEIYTRNAAKVVRR
jgi:hypothetical protein